MPDPRSEVAAAVVNGEIVIVGGFRQVGANSRRVDAYSPKRNRWRRLPDLPLAVDHSTAAAYRGRLYVVGRLPLRPGAFARGVRVRRAAGAACRRCRRRVPRPAPRSPPASSTSWAVSARTGSRRTPSRTTRPTRRWRTIPGPTPREHLGVTAARGRVFVIAGRTAGFDTNLDLVEAYSPATRRWTTLPPGARHARRHRRRVHRPLRRLRRRRGDTRARSRRSTR